MREDAQLTMCRAYLIAAVWHGDHPSLRRYQRIWSSLAGGCVRLGPPVTHTEGRAMQLWPATIARPPPRGVGSWHSYAYAKTMPLCSHTEQARTGARPSSLGTGLGQRLHIESLRLRARGEAYKRGNRYVLAAQDDATEC